MSGKSLMYQAPKLNSGKSTQDTSNEIVKNTSKKTTHKDVKKADQVDENGSNIDNTENQIIEKNQEIDSNELIQDTLIDDNIVNDEVNQDTSENNHLVDDSQEEIV